MITIVVGSFMPDSLKLSFSAYNGCPTFKIPKTIEKIKIRADNCKELKIFVVGEI